MNIFERNLIHDLRRTIIQLLAYDVDYSLNSHLICDALAAVGKTATHAETMRQCRYLEAHAFVVIKNLATDICVISLTDSGLDLARGKIKHPGVRNLRPSELSEQGQGYL